MAEGIIYLLFDNTSGVPVEKVQVVLTFHWIVLTALLEYVASQFVMCSMMCSTK